VLLLTLVSVGAELIPAETSPIDPMLPLRQE
jgi:hypothetical protein